MNCVRSAYGDDPNQYGELRWPEGPGPHPVVFFIHGGFWRAAWDLTHAIPFCEALNAAGLATWSIEYRRIGQPGGGFPGTCEDVLAAGMHLRRIGGAHGLDLSRVALAGHSAGGHLALWLAAQGAIELRGVVALAAVSDLRRAWELRLSNGVVGEFLGAAPDYARASPIEMLPMATPQRLVHGTADDIVPFELSERFAKASANAVLVRLEGVGHRELIEPAAGCWPVVMKQLMEVAGDEGGGR